MLRAVMGEQRIEELQVLRVLDISKALDWSQAVPAAATIASQGSESHIQICLKFVHAPNKQFTFRPDTLVPAGPNTFLVTQTAAGPPVLSGDSNAPASSPALAYALKCTHAPSHAILQAAADHAARLKSQAAPQPEAAPRSPLHPAVADNHQANGSHDASWFDRKTDKASSDMYFHYYGMLQHQQNMLQDMVRTGTYQFAIVENRADFEGQAVMDVGAGEGRGRAAMATEWCNGVVQRAAGQNSSLVVGRGQP